MCNFNRINLGTNWKEELFDHPKKITKYQSLSTEESFATTFEYPDKNTAIKIIENQISHNTTREIVKYDEARNPILSTLFSFLNNEWHKLEESQYSYNSKENIKNCKRLKFPKNGNNIIEKSETKTLKAKKKLKKIITDKATTHQSIEEFTFDDYGREIEFMMYEIQNGEQMNVLKTTNQFDKNIEIYSVFSTKSKESNEWSMISKTITETFPQKMIEITEYFEDSILASKEKQIKYLNSLKQIVGILISEWSENSWKLISKLKYEYSNKYLIRESRFSFKNNTWFTVEKTEFENAEGFITKKTYFEKDDRTWVKTSEQLYEYI